ncbi:MAG: hypothetical protein HY006_04340 [Candidatus Sungbacteria bacterium]|nr:hypothetical protein [Candidatus Sungbacteria bacterium]
MQKVTKGDVLSLIVGLPNGEQKKQLIELLLHTGQIMPQDAADIEAEDVRQNFAAYVRLYNEEDVRFFRERFKDHPTYLARALVRARPKEFISYGHAFRVDMEMKLQANLGTITLPPITSFSGHDPLVYMAKLPDLVQADIFSLDMECRFRDYLYFMSRDSEVGFALLQEAIASCRSDYDRKLLQGVADYSRKLLAAEFPEFVDSINESLFPSFHVRWWLDKVRHQSRVLNIGYTGTQKTAFAVIAMQLYGCEKILVVCTAGGRTKWKQEIESYYRDCPEGKVFLAVHASDAAEAVTSPAQFVIVAYSTLIGSTVMDRLKEIPFDGLIQDECQHGKNVGGESPAQRAAICNHLSVTLPLKHIIALSATPWETDPREFGAVASMLEPKMFPSPETFSHAAIHPRVIREMFDEHVVDAELREVIDLPDIDPKPWEDQFGVELIRPDPRHEEFYVHVRERDGGGLPPAQKVQRLLLAATHPHALRYRREYEWPEEWGEQFWSWELSTKLRYVRAAADSALARGAKVVIASGMFVSGITRPMPDSDVPWVGGLLQEWYGKKSVAIIDGKTVHSLDTHGMTKREQVINEWRFNPHIRFLLISMLACPDSINLSVPKLPGIEELFITALSFRWVPWVQFLGRFWREGQGVPIRFRVPILEETIDESLLRMLDRRLRSWRLFRALVPATTQELAIWDREKSIHLLAQDHRSHIDHVNIIGAMVRGRGEQGALAVLDDQYRVSADGEVSTNGLVYAQSFLESHEYATSGHIARCIGAGLRMFQDQGLMQPEKILDAGCGPLTMERELQAPVYGIDMNPYTIELARPYSPFGGQNARVGLLSQLPAEWTGMFECVVCSLALDWTQLVASQKRDSKSDRIAVIENIVRVAHASARIWITMTYPSMDQETLRDWIIGFRNAEFSIVEELTGLIQSREHAPGAKPFRFWSLCFSPGGKQFLCSNPDLFRLAFEKPQIMVKRGSNGERRHIPREHVKARYDSFEVIQPSGAVEELSYAAERAAQREVERVITMPESDIGDWQFHNLPNLPWRTLEAMAKRGILPDIGVNPVRS